nr:hypothetical protein Iba_chr08bCG3060 [Ipomoea batatas]
MAAITAVGEEAVKKSLRADLEVTTWRGFLGMIKMLPTISLPGRKDTTDTPLSKSKNSRHLADYSCRRSCGGATNLLPPKRKQNRGATGPYCRRKENRRKKRRRPLQPEVVAPLLPPEVHRHCRVADLEEEASKLL